MQVAPANAKTKTCKRACLPKRTKDRKDAAKMKDRMTKDKNGQLVTSGIKPWGLCGYANILPRIKFGVTGQGSSPQSPTFHTADRYMKFYE
ncbi:MAG: hypothetical protein Q7U47_05950 [Paludibacter sp.]|nr:hypothetical protein [Paludibacter sp.]